MNPKHLTALEYIPETDTANATICGSLHLNGFSLSNTLLVQPPPQVAFSARFGRCEELVIRCIREKYSYRNKHDETPIEFGGIDFIYDKGNDVRFSCTVFGALLLKDISARRTSIECAKARGTHGMCLELEPPEGISFGLSAEVELLGALYRAYYALHMKPIARRTPCCPCPSCAGMRNERREQGMEPFCDCPTCEAEAVNA